MNKYKFDFLIIGGGLAGLYAALEAAKSGTVALLTKKGLCESNSYYAQGGIAAAIDGEDSPDFHFADTITAGRQLCDPEAVRTLVTEGVDRVRDLIDLGMNFDKKNGALHLGLEGGHSRRRILHAGGDATGSEVMTFLIGLIVGVKNISVFENTYVHNLLISGGEASGALAYNHILKQNIIFTANSTLIATGGASGIFSRTTNPHSSTGDGLVLAYNAGARLSGMEFVQFHPTAFYHGLNEAFLISEAIRGEGTYLVDINGERFMEGVHELKELAPRDVVSKAIFNRMKATNTENVFLKFDHLNVQKIKERFPHIIAEVQSHGIDISKDLLPVAPAAHYMIGGIKSDIDGRTNIRRLYTAGEAASTGIHGANRLASNSLLECLVFGKRAIDHARNLPEQPQQGHDFEPFRTDESLKNLFAQTKIRISSVMNDMVGIIRTQQSLLKAGEIISRELDAFTFSENEYYSYRLQSLCSLSQLIIESALSRKESRGAHQREDCPGESDECLFNIIQQKDNVTIFEEIPA